MADNKTQKKELSPYQKGVAKALTQYGEAQTKDKIFRGESITELDNLINKASQIQKPTNERMRILESLLSGGGILQKDRPMRTAPIGEVEAVKYLKDLLSLQEAIQSPEQKLKIKEEEAAATAKGGGIGKQEIATQELNSALNAYFVVGENLPTGEGLERFTVGIDNIIQSVEQKTPAGIATARIDALNKWLRVKLVRKAGDVGNLNIVEQLAAEQMLFSKFDSTQMRGLKKELLTIVAEGVNKKNPDQVREAINKWMSSSSYEKVIPSFNSEEEVIKAAKDGKLPKGTEITIRGESAIWE
jgi:hypothetical protein